MTLETKAILLDLDYTLIDASDGIYLCIKYALENMGYPVPERKKAVSTIGLHFPDKFKVLTTETSEDKIKKFETLFIEHAKDVLIHNTKLLNATMPFLDKAVGEGYKLALVTSKYRRSLNDVLDKFNLKEYFQFHIAGDEVTNLKPHPMSIIKALDTLNIARNEAVFIGDSLVDAEAASRAELDFIGVLTGNTEKEHFVSFPNLAILEDLEPVIDTIKDKKMRVNI